MKDDIKDIILDAIIKYEPRNNEHLVELLVDETNFSKDEILNSVRILNRENKIRLLENKSRIPNNFIEYLFSRDNAWLWITTTIGIVSIASFYLIDYNSQFIMIRYLSNLIYVFFIPGFSLNKYFFGENTQSLDEITMGSMILSIILISAIGTIFYYSFIGLNFNIIMLVVFMSTLIFSFLSLLKTYNKIIEIR